MSSDASRNAFGTEQLVDDPDVNIMFEVSWEVANKGDDIIARRHVATGECIRVVTGDVTVVPTCSN